MVFKNYKKFIMKIKFLFKFVLKEETLEIYLKYCFYVLFIIIMFLDI